MRKNQIFIITLLLILLPMIAEASFLLEFFIQNRYHKLASLMMKEEIIRQMKEKEGMTIETYLMKQYFERLFKGI